MLCFVQSVVADAVEQPAAAAESDDGKGIAAEACLLLLLLMLLLSSKKQQSNIYLNCCHSSFLIYHWKYTNGPSHVQT